MIGLAVLVATNWHDVRQITGYGLFGGFVLSILGGATIPVPLPVTAVYFALGGVLRPWPGAEALVPALIGLVCGFGEAVGGISIYATGYSGGTLLAKKPASERPGRMQRLYLWVMRVMQKQGPWTLFAVSALINPFFYPVSLAAGITRFNPKRYFFICLAGKIVKCTCVSYAGYLGLSSLFRAFGISV
jgi:membrane protein DedA with SNARE-associated domain